MEVVLVMSRPGEIFAARVGQELPCYIIPCLRLQYLPVVGPDRSPHTFAPYSIPNTLSESSCCSKAAPSINPSRKHSPTKVKVSF